MSKKVVNAGLEFENLVRGSLKRIGFNDVSGGPGFKIGEYQIDACGGWDDVLLIVECTYSEDDDAAVRRKITDLRGKFAGIRKTLRNIGEYEKYRRLTLAVVSNATKFNENHEKIAKEKPDIHLISYQTLEYYQGLSTKIGRGALFNLLGELGIVPQDLSLPKVPALCVQLPPKFGPAYLFWCEPKALLEVAYVARRELGRGHYYQRMLETARLQKIGKFIDDGGVFPNNIIICFDEDKKPLFREKAGYEMGWPEWLRYGELVFPKSYRSAWVIDGQHRLFSFKGRVQNPKVQKLAVFAFHGLPQATQAKFFVEINHEQKAVSPDLIWDLKGDLESAGSDDWMVSNCVKALNSIPPLKNQIFLPLTGQRKRGQLKMSGVCLDIQEAGLLNDRTRYMAQVQKNPLAQGTSKEATYKHVATSLAEFLSELRKGDEKLWDKLILKPGGLTVAVGVYEQILARQEHKPSAAELETYATAFLSALMGLAPSDSSMKSLQKGLTSYAQRRDVLKDVLLRMQEELNDKDFGVVPLKDVKGFEERVIRLERELSRLVARQLGIADVADLKQKAPEGVWRNIKRIVDDERTTHPDFEVHRAFGLGDIKQILERQDNRKSLMPLLTCTEAFHSEPEALAALEHIMEARKRVHGRRRGTMLLVNSYMDIFERCCSQSASATVNLPRPLDGPRP